MTAHLPSFSTGANLLDAFCQSHHKPLSAFGDLTDNARECGAKHLRIGADMNADNNADSTNVIITMTDDGCGMSELIMRTGIGGIAHTEKAANAEQHYGVGAKSALTRLSTSSLVFSKTASMRTVALLSSTLSRSLKSTELIVPITSYAAGSDRMLRMTTDDAPLTYDQRLSSLKVILEHTCFHTEQELLAQFEHISGPTGTHLCLYESNKEVYDIHTEEDDIRISPQGQAIHRGGDGSGSGGEAKPAAHEVSLRAYLEVLFYSDADTSPQMRISVRDVLVPPRDWSTFLHGWPEGKAAYSYNPACLRDESLEENRKAYGASVRFGTKESLDTLYKVFSSKGAKLSERKRDLENYSGVCAATAAASKHSHAQPSHTDTHTLPLSPHRRVLL